MKPAVLHKDITSPQVIDFEAVINSFISSQDLKNTSKVAYIKALRYFFSWVVSSGFSPENLNIEHVLTFKNNLLNAGLSPLTAAAYLTAVRRFFEWAEANKIYPNIAKGVKTPKREKTFKKAALSLEKTTEILEVAKKASLRDFALVNLLLRTGLRTIELERANVGDIQTKNGRVILFVHGKGRDGKDSFVVLSDKAAKPLFDYLATRKGINEKSPLFAAEGNRGKGERLKTRTIRHIVKMYLKAVGLDNKFFTTHSLRHTTAVNILRAGGSLEQAQKTLRHANPATTQIYTATIEEERRLQHAGELLLDTLF